MLIWQGFVILSVGGGSLKYETEDNKKLKSMHLIQLHPAPTLWQTLRKDLNMQMCLRPPVTTINENNKYMISHETRTDFYLSQTEN